MTTQEALELRKGDNIRVRKQGGKRTQRAMVIDTPHLVDERWVLFGYSLRHADTFDSDLRSGYHVAIIGGPYPDHVERDA